MHTTRVLASLSVLASLGAGAATAASAQTLRRAMNFADVMDLKNVGAVAIAPDASAIAYTVSGWEHPDARRNGDTPAADTANGDHHNMRSHIWIVPARNGTARQLTFSERGESAPAWSPDGRSLAFLSARGGADPKPQIWILPMDGGEAYRLTSSHESITGFSWSPSGDRIAFLAVDSLGKDDDAKRKRGDDPQVYEGALRLSHVWVTAALPGSHATELVHGDFTVKGAPTWSPDATALAYQASPTTLLRETRTDAWVVSIADRKNDKISGRADVASTPAWSPDGHTLAYTSLPQSHVPRPDSISDVQIGNSHIMLYDVGSRSTRDTYDPQVDISAGAPQWTADGKRLLFTAEEGAFASVYALDVATGKQSRVVDKLLMRGFTLSHDTRTAAFAMETPNAPADVYVSDLSFAAPRKLTDVNPQLRNLALGQTEVVKWKSTDGTPVEGVLLKPVGYVQGQRYPLLVEAHGGPTGATSAGFKANWGSPGQVWAGAGWAVLYPNPRGSTGYGEKFTRANIMDWGGGDYRDIMTGVDALVQRGLADSTRLAFEGWSYGGYMTAWTVSQTSRFKAARMGAGLSDLQSMYGTTDIPGYIGTFFSGVPTAKTLDFYRARSAITFVDQVTTPLLILHGGSDERVPVGQAMEYYRALRDRGKTVQLVFYPREGHGFSEYYHQLDKMRREYDWITRYTLGGTPKSAALLP